VNILAQRDHFDENGYMVIEGAVSTAIISCRSWRSARFARMAISLVAVKKLQVHLVGSLKKTERDTAADIKGFLGDFDPFIL